MRDPAPWQDGPYELEVAAGERVVFCLCGRTARPPLCDGAHASCGVMPVVIRFPAARTIRVCGCGRSRDQPYCDGSHARPPRA